MVYVSTPVIVCQSCNASTAIESSKAGTSKKSLAVNVRTVLGVKLLQESYSSLKTSCSVTTLPSPSKTTCIHYHHLIKETMLHVTDSLQHAREEVTQFDGELSEDEIIDCLVSVDGKWQSAVTNH